MKKLFMLTMAAVAVAACEPTGNGNDDGTDIKNEVTVDGTVYEIAEATMYDYGAYYDSDVAAIDLEFISSDEDELYFEMTAPAGNTKLVAGTYVYDADAGKEPDEFVIVSGDANGLSMTEGTIEVSVSGNIYTIEIEGILVGDIIIEGQYRGEVDSQVGED